MRQGRNYRSWQRLILICCAAVLGSVTSNGPSIAQALSSVGVGDKTLLCGQDEIPVLSVGKTTIRTKTRQIDLQSAHLCLGTNSIRQVKLEKFEQKSSEQVRAGTYWVHTCQKGYMPLTASGQTKIDGKETAHFVEISAEKGLATCLKTDSPAKTPG